MSHKKEYFIEHLAESIDDKDISNIPKIEDELNKHLLNNPEKIWMNKAYVFQSSGISGKLMYILYDKVMWDHFVKGYKDAINSIIKLRETTKVSFVGSNDLRHTLPRISKTISKCKTLTLGLQSKTTSIMNDLLKFEPDILVVYGGFVKIFLNYLEKHNYYLPTVKGVLLTTEEVDIDDIILLKSKLNCKISQILTSTEIGIIGHTCNLGNFHLNNGVSIKESDGKWFFDNNINKIQKFKDYEIPINIKVLGRCNCNKPGIAFNLLNGRKIKLITLLNESGEEFNLHPIFFRSILDRLKCFPGAKIYSKNNTLHIELLEFFDYTIIKNTIRNHLGKAFRNMEINIYEYKNMD